MMLSISLWYNVRNFSQILMITNFIFNRSLYVNELLFEMVGVEMSISIDIALSLGTTESIVESLYSVMKSQGMEGGQDNDTLALR